MRIVLSAALIVAAVLAPAGVRTPVGAFSTAPIAAVAARADHSWAWPVDGPRRVLRAYSVPAGRYGPGHRGVDLAAGATALAPEAGVVRFAGFVVDRPVLTIDHGGGVLSSYEPVESALEPGDAVARGQPIGTVLGGHCGSVDCLHMGVRVHGQYVSPLRYLEGIPRAVLLPTR